MGYTHYFSQTRHATTKEWGDICKAFKHTMLLAKLPIQLESDEAKKPTINDEQIRFNGIDDDGHETMLVQKDNLGFNFCKTARKPYDRAVVALLLIMEHYAPGCWGISSDGDIAGWKEDRDWLANLIGVPVKIPGGVTA